jgi:hypothetical protein
MCFALQEVPNGRLRYFTGKVAIPHPSILAKIPTCSTFLTGINTDLAKLTFKPEAASNSKKTLQIVQLGGHSIAKSQGAISKQEM